MDKHIAWLVLYLLVKLYWQRYQNVSPKLIVSINIIVQLYFKKLSTKVV